MTAPKVVGLDLSLASTGVACNLGWADHIRVKRSTVVSPFTRPRQIRTAVMDHVRGAALVVVEGLAVHSQTGRHLERAGLWHLVMEEIDGADIAWAEVSPTGLKKYATGKGNAAKDEVLAAVIKRFPTFDVGGNDQADALVLAAMGSDHLGHPLIDMPVEHRKALKAVAWPGVA